MSHLTTRDRTVSPDDMPPRYGSCAGCWPHRAPAGVGLGDMLLHELESHPEYTLIIQTRACASLVLRPDPLLLAEAYFRRHRH
jgi:cyclopropane-fatty-acyl-phospholipid synthase